MTIKGLATFLKKRVPGAFERNVTAAQVYDRYRGQTIACDLPGYFHKFAYLTQTFDATKNEWCVDIDACAESLSTLSRSFWENGVAFVYVLDGRRAQQAKRGEHVRRAKNAASASASAAEHNQRVVDEQQRDAKRARVSGDDAVAAQAVTVDAVAALAAQQLGNDASPAAESSSNASALKRPPVRLNSQHYDALTLLLTYCRVPFYKALGEGEHLAALCCASEHDLQFSRVAAVMSDDLDAVACGAVHTIRFWQHSQHACEIIDLAHILRHFRIDYARFLDFCILCGCDFTGSSLPGVGPVAAMTLLQTYQSLENIGARRNIVLNRYKHPRTQIRAADVWPDFEYEQARYLLGSRLDNKAVSPHEWIEPTWWYAIERVCALSISQTILDRRSRDRLTAVCKRLAHVRGLAKGGVAHAAASDNKVGAK